MYASPKFKDLVGQTQEFPPDVNVCDVKLFNNPAEYRGFLRGFATVGVEQQIKLPPGRFSSTTLPVTLLARKPLESPYVYGFLKEDDPSKRIGDYEEFDWQQAINDLPLYFLRVSGSGELLYQNQLTEAELKFSGESGLGRMSTLDADWNAKKWPAKLRSVRTSGLVEYETNFVGKNGSLIPVRVNLCEPVGLPVRAVTMIAWNASRSRRTEAQLESAKLELNTLKYEQERSRALMSDDYQTATSADIVVATDSPFQAVLKKAHQVAPTDATVLITGETGTGKELIAKHIHRNSVRHEQPLVTVNCGALPKDLIESELFGYRKGAFTGATRDRIGRFELADGGTLFLDEIGEMPLLLQTRLLRFLQEGEFTPVGGHHVSYADVRIVAATNRNLQELVNSGDFRADLYFRLNVFPIQTIPLRDRSGDIAPLVRHFMRKHRRRLNSDATTIDEQFLQQLLNYPFYGNVRELENLVERAMITSKGQTLKFNLVHPPTGPMTPQSAPPPPAESSSSATTFPDFEEMQRNYIIEVLRSTNGKVSGPGGAADVMKLNPQTLYSKLRKLNINKDSVP